MSDDDHILTHVNGSPPPIPFSPPQKRGLFRGRHLPRPPRPRMKKFRLLLIMGGFAVLAGISTLFGMMMAVASDLPQLENRQQYHNDTRNSYLYDDQGKPIGILAPPDHTVLDSFFAIAPNMRRAIVSVEDKRFWTESGIDIRGLARAALNDIAGGARQGASTIPEEFVKNALAEQDNRTVFEKVREAAMAYHLTREWKKGKILREYLNSIYFGHGAYGIESAARIYFGTVLGFNDDATAETGTSGCGDANAADPKLPKCASKLQPWQSALLAGMVANPSAFDPIAHPKAATERRDLVLYDMWKQGYISHDHYLAWRHKPLPTSSDIQAPAQPAAAPYFTSWVEPQVISTLEREGVPKSIAAYRAYYGGLKIKTTIDLTLQQEAQNAVDAEFPPGSNGPTASLVAIDNKTGEVRAMVSGNQSYATNPFNLATQGHRQPGSSMKVFTLATALSEGKYGPDSIIDSKPVTYTVPNSGGKEKFVVHNFGDTYSGPITLSEATAISDNTVFAQVGLATGTRKIAAMAKAMGIRSPVSHNDAMTLGGLKVGVSALDMAHAYETVAEGGRKVYNPILGDMDAGKNRPGPTGIQSISCPKNCPKKFISDHPTYKRIFPASVASTIHDMLKGPVSSGGTAPMAAIPGVDVVGKTGTTSNYVDAWFVGWTPQMTVAVWVGYPNSATPMATNYNGEPVEGGTFPAIIWHNFMVPALSTLSTEAQDAAARKAEKKSATSTTTSVPTSTSEEVPTTGVDTATAVEPSTPTPETTTHAETTTPAPEATTPATPTTPTPEPTPTPTTPVATPTTPAAPDTGTTSGGAGLTGGG